MRLGISKAKDNVAEHSVLMHDWAHVIGVTTDGRTGLLQVVQKALSVLTTEGQKEHYSFVRDWLFAMRTFPIRLLLDIVLESILDFLETQGESPCAKKIRSHPTLRRSRVSLDDEA